MSELRHRQKITSKLTERSEETPKILEKSSLKLAIIKILVIFAIGIFILFGVFKLAPPLTDEEKTHVKLPKNFDDARALGNVLETYTEEYFSRTFSIPGSVFLSVLAGYLFNTWLAMFFVCLCSAIGASFAYILAHIIGHIVVQRFCQERVDKWRVQVDKNRDDLMSYMLFLRITPFLPNWFINITSPILSIPLTIFFTATFIGVSPLSFIAVSAGKEIQKLIKFQDALSYDSIILVVVAAILSLIPILVKKYFGKKFGMDESEKLQD